MVKISPFSLYTLFTYTINMKRTEVVKTDTEVISSFRNLTLHEQLTPPQLNPLRGVKAKINSLAICSSCLMDTTLQNERKKIFFKHYTLHAMEKPVKVLHCCNLFQ